MIKLVKIYIAAFSVFVVAIAGFSGFYFLSSDSIVDDSVVAESTDKPLSAYTQGSQTDRSTQQISVGQDQPKQPTLPTPDQFSIYEEYSNSESALYIDITTGTGREVVSGDKIAMLYTGYLTNGELFDQTKPNENNELQPFVFTVGNQQVIPGWEQTIAGMKVGGKRRLIIPSQLGYGSTGQGAIPPNAMLIFDVELAGIEGQ